MTAESIVSFLSRLSVALSSPQRVHSTSAWQSFLLCFEIQFRLMSTKRKQGEGTDMKTLAFILELFLNLIFPPLEFVAILQYTSTSWGIYLVQSHRRTLKKMPMPGVDMACHHGGQGRQIHPGGPHLLLAGLSTLPQVVTHSSWCSFPDSPFSLLLHRGTVPPALHLLVPILPSTHGAQGQGYILPLWWQHRNTQQHWRFLVYLETA